MSGNLGFGGAPFGQSVHLRVFFAGAATRSPAPGPVPPDVTDLVRRSLLFACDVLNPHGIGVRLLPTGGQAIAHLPMPGALVRVVRMRGPGHTDTDHAQALRARSLAGARFGPLQDACVVIVGDLDTRLRGHTVETGPGGPTASSPYWFCCLNRSNRVFSPLLHEVLHCANLQHYMARTDLLDPATADPHNIMSQATERAADLRTRLLPQEITLLRRAWFVG